MNRLPPDFWLRTPIRPVPVLGELRDIVMSITEKRQPIWRFVLDDDFVMRIQARPSQYGHRFECKAVLAEDPIRNGVLVKPRKAISCKCFEMNFDLTALSKGEWTIKPTSITRDRQEELRQRVVDTFDNGRFDKITPDMLIGQQCLMCGKALTDPVSQARLIGPECHGRMGGAAVHFRLPVQQNEFEMEFV
jgi:hypothetical protein